MRYKIEVKSRAHFVNMLKCLYALGWNFAGEATLEKFLKSYPNKFNWILISTEQYGKTVYGSNSPYSNLDNITFSQFVEKISFKTIKLANGGAEVKINTDGGIIIGGLTVTKEELKKIYESSNQG